MHLYGPQTKPTNKVDTILLLALTIYVVFQCLDGALRYLFIVAGVGSLTYIKELLFPTLLFLCLYTPFQSRINQRLVINYFLILGAYSILGLLNSGNFFQTTFGFKTLMPVMGGIIISHAFFRKPRFISKLSLTMLTIVFAGTLLGTMGFAPWRDVTISFLNTEIVVGLDTMTGAYRREIGFARTNFQLALSAYIFGCLYICYSQSLIGKTIAWCMAMFVVIVSTTKSIIVIFSIVTLFLAVRKWTGSWSSKLFIRLLPIPVIIGFTLPLLQIGSNYYIDPTAPDEVLLIGSMIARFSFAWPPIVNSIAETYSWILGGGLGAYGTANRMFSDTPLGVVDSIYLFSIGTFGCLVFLWYAWLLNAVKRLQVNANGGDLFVLLFLFAFLVYGITDSSVEDGVTGLFLGLSIGFLGAKRAKNITKPEQISHMDRQYQYVSF